jgi:outer membrane protein, heavy metal efflux system
MRTSPKKEKSSAVQLFCYGLAMACCGLFFPIADSFSQTENVAASAVANRTVLENQLNQLIGDVLKNNPDIKAAQYKIDAARASVGYWKSLDPPQVGVEFMRSPVRNFPNLVKDQMEYDYSIQQMLPFPGKLGTMAKTEQKRTEMLSADRVTAEQQIVRNVKAIYFDVYLVSRRMEMNHETLQLVRQFVDIARKQYELGMGQQSDILRAQTELTSLGKDSIILIQQRKSMEGMLNALCSRPVTTGIEPLPEVNPVIPDYDLNTLLAIAWKNRSELKSKLAGVGMQEAERGVAQKEYLPDFMVRGMYKQMTQSEDDWSLMVGVTVPVAPWSYGKYSSAVTRSEANIKATQAEVENMRNMIAAEVNDAFQKTESAKERLNLSREMAIPQAQQALESAMAAYKTGKQEFLMLIDIQRMLVMAKLEYHMAVMTLLDSQSQLERAVGLSMDELDKVIERGSR